MRRTGTAALAVAALLLAGCAGDADPQAGQSPTPTAASSSSPPSPPGPPGTPTPTAAPTSSAASPTELPVEPAPPRKPRPRDVLAISVDGLNPDALVELGPGRVPAFTRLLEEGAATLEARTEVELTVTLPNHTGMLTGRRVDAARGGHGLTWNDELPGRIVPGPDGDGVASVFDVVHQAGGSTALFAGKDKFATFDRSWPEAIDRFEVDGDPGALVDDVRADLVTADRRLTFVHLSPPDLAGHASGWLSPAYLGSVEETDRLLGELLDTVTGTPRLARRLVVVLTADHGGRRGADQHDDARDPANYTVPFVVWGRGIAPADLYALNQDYADPGDGQPSYDGPQPVRNGDLANLVTDLLGLGPVPGSELDADQDLDVGLSRS